MEVATVAPTAVGSFRTPLFLTSAAPSPLDTGSFVPRHTPGNVGVCLSGGGSRAFSAGIGQLQALATLRANGASLLSQTRALSTVSGGGWIGIPFTFLPPSISDDDFLGTPVDPASLTFDGLGILPAQGIANRITDGFSVVDLAIQALLLYADDGVPCSELWQVLMAETFLRPYGLYVPGADRLPTELFSYDAASLAEIQRDNPGLTSADLVARIAGERRPYLISLSSLSVNVGPQQFLLAPVHSTPFVAGVLSTPPGAVDADGRAVGGGAVTSFAFNSCPVPGTNGPTEVVQSRQWSLTDALGTSSAAFAQTLIDQMTLWHKSPTRFAAALRLRGPKAVQKIARTPEQATRLHAKLDIAIAVAFAGPLAESDLHRSLRELVLLELIVPRYQYWSPADPPTSGTVAPSAFADGGSLENTGVASMLAYADIDNVVAFLNVETPLSRDERGTIVVDDCLPPLFGFQPYVEKQGYVPYVGACDPSQPALQYNQIFDAAEFDALLAGLWDASKNGTAATIFSQTLTTLQNGWFDVAGGRTVTVVWAYLSYASQWHDAISDVFVRGVVDYEYEFHDFPNYDTLNTELSPTQINLLSNLTTWMVRDTSTSGIFTALYTGQC